MAASSVPVPYVHLLQAHNVGARNIPGLAVLLPNVLSNANSFASAIEAVHRQTHFSPSQCSLLAPSCAPARSLRYGTSNSILPTCRSAMPGPALRKTRIWTRSEGPRADPPLRSTDQPPSQPPLRSSPPTMPPFAKLRAASSRLRTLRRLPRP